MYLYYLVLASTRVRQSYWQYSNLQWSHVGIRDREKKFRISNGIPPP